MKSFNGENLCHDPVHGYIRFVARNGEAKDEFCERDLIDHPWVQRMRQIRQLQSAWWVFPTAEHSRFQHILGVMHLASRAVQRLHASLCEVDPDTPPRRIVESLMRVAGLLHDVGHGPFGHFFDAHFLSRYDLTHEKLGAFIIENEIAADLRRLDRTPDGGFPTSVRLDPAWVSWIIQRPTQDDAEQQPRWLRLLRSLFCGIYTIDNMDFVLRDAFMTGLSPKAFDLQRILHYSLFTERGLTIHDRGMPALIHFLGMKAELFRSVYFHRTVRAIDLQLADLFRESREFLFPGDPREHPDAYLHFTEFSLLTDVGRWAQSKNPKLNRIGRSWESWLARKVHWEMVCQRNVAFAEDQSENSSIFSSHAVLAASIREHLPKELENVPFRVDLARHIHRPHTRGVTAGMNYFIDSGTDQVKPLTMHGLYQRLPISHTIVRIYTTEAAHRATFAQILNNLIGSPSEDDLTNM